MATKTKRERPAAGELVITRDFAAPRELIWKAWTEPGLFRRWWGPKGFSTPVSMIDFQVGGRYQYCMRGAGPDGVVRDYWGTGVYREIVPKERIVASDSFADEKGNVVPASHYGMPGKWPLELTVRVTFRKAGRGTRMILRHTGFPTAKVREMAGSGWNESFDKLAEVLKAKGDVTSIEARPGRAEIVVRRTYDAPRSLVYRAYTDPALIPQWWGPRKYATSVDRLDAWPGGLWRFLNRDAGGKEYAFHGVYHGLKAPERIIATFEFEGAPGRVSLETLELAESGGKTLLTNRSVFQSVEDRDEMIGHGMVEGVSETMDRLAELLAHLRAERKAA